MPDQRSVMKEFRSLEQKRAAEGLSPAEEARLAELRELVGPEAGAGGLRGGFDVSAAAARLRDSLLPAGTRNRASPAPERPSAGALEGTGADDPFAPADPGAAAGALLDASTLEPGAPPESGPLAGWDPGAADPSTAYDPASQAYADTAHDGASADWQPPEAFPPGDDAGQQPYATDGAAEASGQEAAAWDADAPFDPSAAFATAFDAGGEPGYDAVAAGLDPDAAPAWDPNAPVAWDQAQPLDPGAPPAWDANALDPNAAYAFDPSQTARDASAAAHDPGQPAPDATAYDPDAAPAWDPNAPAAWDEAQLDPNAPPAWDANALDPNAAYAFDPNQPADDPNAPAYDPDQPASAPDAAALDPNAPAWDPNAAAAWDPNAAPAWDPNAAPAWDPNAAPAWDPNAPQEDAAGPALQGDAAAGAFAEAGTAPGPEDSPGWDPLPSAAPEPASGADVPVGEPEPVPPAPHADPGALAPEGWDLAPPAPEAPPADAPLGEYDETSSAFPSGVGAGLESMLPPGEDAGEDAGLESMLPLDAGAEPATPSGSPPLGDYDDTAGFSGTAFPDVTPADLPIEGGGFEAARVVAPAASEGWHPEPAVDEGFLLESGGSFDAADAAAAPEWAVGAEPTPWEKAAPAGPAPLELPDVPAAPDAALALAEANAPEPAPGPSTATVAPSPAAGAELTSFDVDLDEEAALSAPAAQPAADVDAAPADAAAAPEVAFSGGPLAADADAPGPDLSGPAPALDFSRPDLSEGRPDDDFAMPPEAAPALLEDDIPTIEGEEILEEIPAEDGFAAAPALDFEPLLVPAPAGAAPAPAAPVAAPAIVAPPPPATPVAPRAVEATPAAAAERFVKGSHRVVVHTVEGQVRRGVLEDADLAAASLGLAPQPGAAPELLGTDRVKAIFFMLAAGEKAPLPEGKRVRVTFRDGRQIAGFSPDYDETGPGFFMVPGDTRTNTGRIWVYRASVKQVVVS